MSVLRERLVEGANNTVLGEELLDEEEVWDLLLALVVFLELKDLLDAIIELLLLAGEVIVHGGELVSDRSTDLFLLVIRH